MGHTQVALLYDDKLKQKVTLLCLMNLAVELPPHARTIPFAAIAERTQLAVDQVRVSFACRKGGVMLKKM